VPKRSKRCATSRTELGKSDLRVARVRATLDKLGLSNCTALLWIVLETQRRGKRRVEVVVGGNLAVGFGLGGVSGSWRDYLAKGVKNNERMVIACIRRAGAVDPSSTGDFRPAG